MTKTTQKPTPPPMVPNAVMLGPLVKRTKRVKYRRKNSL